MALAVQIKSERRTEVRMLCSELVSVRSEDPSSNQCVAGAAGVCRIVARLSACTKGSIANIRLVVEPLIECLNFFFGVRRKQVIDSYVGRRYQNRFGVRERIVMVSMNKKTLV